MKKSKVFLTGIIYSLYFLTISISFSFAQQGSTYTDSRGHRVNFPLGDISFVDEIVSFNKGTPSAVEKYCDSSQVIGPPDYLNDYQEPPGYTTLGCGGTLTVQFLDNVLVDVDGPDLYVFEIGHDVEPTEISISKDGDNWINIGKVSGGTAEIDITSYVNSGDIFKYVRLTDIKSACSGGYPGADIDAIGAIGSAVQITLKASVLFDFNKYILKTEAQNELNEAADKIKNYQGSKIIIAGHTDNIGPDEYNQELSKYRAAAVRDYLLTIGDLKNFEMEIKGYGESRPIATNDTEEGREKNRRVEILIIPLNK